MTPDQIKQRLEEAGQTLMALPMPRNGVPVEYGNNWPEIVRNFAEQWGAQIFSDAQRRKEMADDRNRVRIQPTARDIADMDEALEWMWFLTDTQRRICMARSLKNPYTGRYKASYRKIAKLMSCSESFVRREHDKALNKLARELNGTKRQIERLFK